MTGVVCSSSQMDGKLLTIVRSRPFCFLFSVFSSLSSAYAAEGTRPAYAPTPPTVSTGNIIQIIFSLLLVLAAIVLVAWLLKRMNVAQQGSENLLRVLGSVSIGQRERAVLVEIKNTWLVVGVGPGQVRTLHTLEKPGVIEQSEQAGSQPIEKSRSFSAVLSAALGSLSSDKRKQHLAAEHAMSEAHDRSRNVP